MIRRNNFRNSAAFFVAALMLWTTFAVPFLESGRAHADSEEPFIHRTATAGQTPEYYGVQQITSGAAVISLYTYKNLNGETLYRVYGYPTADEATSPEAIDFYASDNKGATAPPYTKIDQTVEQNNAFGGSGTVSKIEDMLKPNEAYISRFAIDGYVDGSASFDADDLPGNDSAPDNNIVRSFDVLHFTLGYTTSLQNQSEPTYFENGTMYVKFVLPGVKLYEANFDLSAMMWLSEPKVTESALGVSVTGYYQLRADEGNTIIPGEGELSAVVKVLGMANGSTITPEFYAWMAGYTEGEAVVGNNEPKKADNGQTFTISASPSSVNIKLQRHSTDYMMDWNFGSGNASAPNKTSGIVNGRIFGYALQLQMVNANGTAKKLKGVELPRGQIDFDIELKAMKSVNSGTYNDVTGTGTDQILPLLWDFKANSRAANGNGGRNMAFAGVSSYIGGGAGAPLNSGGPDAIRTLCVNGGTWSMTQSGNTISVSVDAYEFIKNNIYEWPLRNEGATAGSTIYYGEDRGIGVFSAGFMQVVFPIPSSVDASTAFQLIVSDTNLRTRTLSEPSATGPKSQPVTNDDSNTIQVELVPRGSYDKYNYLSKENETGSPYWADSNLSSMNAMGPDAWAPYGSNISIFGAAVIGADPVNQPYAVDILQKFDAEAVQPYNNAGANPYSFVRAPSASSNLTYKLLYVSKANGANWDSDDEMERAEMDTSATAAVFSSEFIAKHPDYAAMPNPTLKYYATMADLLADTSGLAPGATRKCVAVLLQIRGGIFGFGESRANFNVRILDTAEIGKVYQTTNDVYFWRKDKAENWTHAANSRLTDNAPGSVLNSPDVKLDIRTIGPPPAGAPSARSPYIKTAYDGNGGTTGHQPAGYRSGASLLIVGTEARITASVDQRFINDQNQATNDPKYAYNVGASQRRADYILTPSVLLSGKPGAEGAEPTTVRVTATLPEKVTVDNSTKFYMGGSYDVNTSDRNGGVYNPAGATELTPQVTEVAGKQVLTFVLENITPGPDAVKPIHFSARVGRPGGDDSTDEVINSEQLTIAATITAGGDGRALNVSNGNIAEYTIGIVKLGQASLNKTIEQPIVESGEEIAYRVTHQNPGATDYTGYRMLDVLPYDGDERGSIIHGTYTGKLEITFPNRDSGKTSVSVYALTGGDAYWQGKNALSNFTLPAPLATISADGATHDIPLPAGTRAVYVTGVLGARVSADKAGDSYAMRVVLTPTGNRGADVYCNDVTAVSSSSSQDVMYAPQVAAVVVNRAVSGLAWYDADGDGIRDVGETSYVAGARVTLRDKNGGAALDVSGNPVTAQTTGSDGKYAFSNLREGEFYVMFEGGVGFDIEKYKVSPKKVGSAATDSDVTPVPATGTLTSARTDTFALPGKANIGLYGYNLYNLDAGFVPPEPEEPKAPDPEPIRTVSGLAWYDANGNGIRDNGEMRVAGARVTLRDNTGNIARDAGGNPVPSVTTVADGEYLFTNLSAGDFYVLFEGGAGFDIWRYNLSPKDSGGDDTLDSDVTVASLTNTLLASAKTDSFTLPLNTEATGYHKRNMDAGFVPRPSGGGGGGGDPDPDPEKPTTPTTPTEPTGPTEPTEPTDPGNGGDTPDRPTPTPGHSIVPGDGGSYVELDENGTPLGEWRYDPDTGEWIFDEYPPLTDSLPQTGNIWERNESVMWMMFFFWLIVLTGLMLLNRIRMRVSREYYF